MTKFNLMDTAKSKLKKYGILRAIYNLRKKSFTGIFRTKLLNITKEGTLVKLFARLEIKIGNGRFVYFIDENICCYGNAIPISNFTIDYSKIVNGSLSALKSGYGTDMDAAADALIFFAVRIANTLQRVGDNRAAWFFDMVDKPVDSLSSALQRILFINQIIWQTGHKLNGLGRLDFILDAFADEANAYTIIKDFCETLHSHYNFKSSVLLGDTGQIIVLGGRNEDGSYFRNRLTDIFLKVNPEINLPDPKILLRVCADTPREIWEKAVKCLISATGSPLFSNDDVVVPAMLEYGYEKSDVYKYTVSACWEPYLPGLSRDPNNSASLNFALPLVRVLEKAGDADLFDFERFIAAYETELTNEAENIGRRLDEIVFNKEPVVSLFFDDCRKTNADIAVGGAKYNNFGVTGVGMPNVINALLNIKKFVFEDKKYSLKEMQSALAANYVGYDNIHNDLKGSNTPKFGDDETVILTNRITKSVSDYYRVRKNKFAGGIKFGLSSPGYISGGKLTNATADGRKAGEHFATHISAEGYPYTQLINFASKLEYNNGRFNGNVVDFFVAPNFIKNNFDKFVDFLILAQKQGYFQMQMNVVSAQTLIEARKNPKAFPDLIVRVWGFSAYFKDLPDSYKDVLIERALAAEGR